MNNFEAREGLNSATQKQAQPDQITTSTAQPAISQIPSFSPALDKFILQGGSILAFLIVLWLLLQQFNRLLIALTALVKAIK